MVGGAYVFFGSEQPDNVPDYSLEGETRWSNYGIKVGSLGDVNGDGYDEFYIFADGYPDSENPLGKAYIYSLKKFVVDVVKDSKTKLPQDFKLSQNHPNPFNNGCVIKYSIPEQSQVELKVYDVLGREVAELVNKAQPSGSYQVNFDASSLGSGVYFYQIRAGSFVQSKKMVLLK